MNAKQNHKDKSTTISVKPTTMNNYRLSVLAAVLTHQLVPDNNFLLYHTTQLR